MLELFDNLPVIELPDGRRALVDTGCNGAEILTAAIGAPVMINNNAIEPTVASVDLGGIGEAIGVPGLDMLIGASLLGEGFTADLRNGTFTFAATNALPNEEVLVVLPYTTPEDGPICSPVVEFEIGGERTRGVFDTGAPYSLWKFRSAESNRLAEINRTDFYIDSSGQLIRFPVMMRTEPMRLGAIAFELDLAYLPESWPEYLPSCVYGMDIPAALGAERFILDPEMREIRFYRRPGIAVSR